MIENIVIAVCTAQRPKMLKACLESLEALEVPEGARISVVIVENTPAPQFGVLSEVPEQTGEFIVPIAFYHEPRIGIPFARNRAFEAALEQKADWIALIDDDERAAPDWLAKLYSACKSYDAEVANGPVQQIFEVPPPHWWKSQEVKAFRTGDQITEAPTNNVLLNARLVRPQGLELRFDERLTFGSEDIDFFRRAHRAGAKMIWVEDAWVEENVPASRLSTSRLLSRVQMVASSAAYNVVIREGRAKAVAYSFRRGVRRMLVGGVATAVGFLLKLVVRDRGERLYYYGLIRLMKGSGNLRGLLSQPHRYYDVIDGH